MSTSASPERERLDVDLLFVGAGAATLAAVIRLADLCESRGVELPDIMVIEKAAQIGAHQLSGAVIDASGLRELMPDFRQQGFPLECEVTQEFVYFLTKRRALRLPPPPPMRNHGNLVVSLSKLVCWLAGKAEERGIAIYPGFPAAEPILQGDRVVGVRIQDAGIDREGRPKASFEPGPEIRAKCVIFGEGSRGSCTKMLQDRFGLHGDNAQAYETGVKEIWRVAPDKHRPGRVIHTLGYPFDAGSFGGTWLYDMADGLVSVGVVTGLNSENPYSDPHDNLQRFKLHPKVRAILEGGECIRYGAKTLPAGGLFSFPELQMDGALFIGDAAGFCNGQRLKGVHQAIQSGMLCAAALLDAIEQDDFSAKTLSVYTDLWKCSASHREHRRSRNWHSSFSWVQKLPRWLGWLRQAPWIVNGMGVALLTGGRGLVDKVPHRPDHSYMKKLSQLSRGQLARARQKVAYDNLYTFDKVTAAALAGSQHEVDQPYHLKVADPNLCATTCAEEYGNPCESFCPAAVYELIDDDAAEGGRSLLIHHENCVHCKTCDIADPYQQISWTTPEGGGGPDYTLM